MKAIVLREFGGPEVLSYEDVSVPRPAVGEVLMKVHSVSVNRTLDLVVRAGNYPVKIQMPHVLGVDPAGEIIGIGKGVDRFKLGDRVAVVSFIACRRCKQCLKGEEACCVASQHIGLHRWGGYADYVVVPAGNAFKLPDNVSYAHGSVIARHFPMAFNQLTSKAHVKPGEWVLVMGATGALGNCCVQVAKMLGARVIAGAGADERVELAKSYGAEFGINYRRQDLLAEVMRLTGNEGVDVVCENISDPTLWEGAFNSLAINGTMVTAGAHGGGTVTLDMKRLYMRRLRVIGTAGTNVPDVYKALDAAGQVKIRAIIDRIMPLREAAEAHRIVERNETAGKVILDPTAS
jgi:NADPH:quinone reductase-like Zn-dependent oxidoreductase